VKGWRDRYISPPSLLQSAVFCRSALKCRPTTEPDDAFKLWQALCPLFGPLRATSVTFRRCGLLVWV
jgi:hypothetical protein